MKPLTVLIALFFLAACGEATNTGGGAEYRTVGFVLDERDRGPELCLGIINQSYPPQCAGEPIEGWDWGSVGDEESASGATWGTYEVVGRYDGDTFMVTEVGHPPETIDEDDALASPCSEPAGGWSTPDPERASQADAGLAISAAEREPDFAGGWIYQAGEPSESNTNEVVLNLAFTGDIERHEEEARRLWGGPLCVVEYEHTYSRLRQIQRELSSGVAEDLGLDIVGSDVDASRNVVHLGVVTADPDARAKIDERYGEGTVELDARLEPVK